MGYDPFFEQIIEKLKGELDPYIFEDCAADLLQEDFPGIAPIRGGCDAGRDGAIPDGEGVAYPLVCTTGENVIGNLTKNIKSYLDDGGSRRKVVVVTSQFLTEKRIRNLEKRAGELGFTLVQVFDGNGIAHKLYKRPEWCKRLLDLTGNPPALSVYPQTSRPLFEQPIIGRVDDIEWLQGRTSDSILVGQPGSGKTFLLYSLVKTGWGLFLVDDDLGRIADAIRSQNPGIIIMDDAHVRIPLLQRLIRLRQEIHADFVIVASCWPGSVNEIMSVMSCPQGDTRTLELIDRDSMVHIVAGAGIVGPTRLVWELVTQAHGKPGLAVTLVDLCKKGGIRDVITGEALSRSIRQSLVPIEGKEIVDILAAFSLAGDVGLPPKVVADFVRISTVQMRNKLSTLNAGGVIHVLSQNHIRVQPEILRFALIKDVFFDSPAPLPFKDLVINISTHELALSLIGAKRIGASVRDDFLRDIISDTISKEVWGGYAGLGRDETSYVLQKRSDLVVEIAEPILYHNPHATLQILLEKSVGDFREILSSLDHPLRKIYDWIKHTIHNEEEGIKRREILLQVLTRWIGTNQDPDVAVHALTFLFMPFVESVETDPGLGRTILISTRYLSVDSINSLFDLWKRSYEILKNITITNWKHFFSRLHDLVYPYVSQIEIPDEVYNAYRNLAVKMIIDLAKLGKDHPGVILKLQPLAKELRVSISAKKDILFSTLFPSEKRGADISKSFRQWVKKAEKLARLMTDQSPNTIAKEISRVEQEAELANINWPRLTPYFCEVLAKETQNPSDWVDCLIGYGCNADVVKLFLECCVQLRVEGYEYYISNCLDNKKYSWVAISVTLSHPPESGHILSQVLDMLPEYKDFIGQLVLTKSVSKEILYKLLGHTNDDVAEATVLGMWQSKPKGTIDEDFRDLWRQAFVRAKNDEYWIGDIIESDNSLAFEWLAAHIDASSLKSYIEDNVYKRASNYLDREQRIKLLESIKEDSASRPHLIEYIINDDIEVFKNLISRQDLKEYHLAPLKGFPISGWIERAKIALAAGYTPRDIAEAALENAWPWHSHISEMWKQWMDHAQTLLASDDYGLKAIGKEIFDQANEEYQRAIERVMEENVYGY